MLNRIVERDRINSGRKSPNENIEKENVISDIEEVKDQNNNITRNITKNITAQKTAHPLRKKEEQKASLQRSLEPTGLQLAQQLAETRLIPITLRLPEGLNDWLDDYAHANRKQGVKKQDLVTRAVQLLVMEMSAGR